LDASRTGFLVSENLNLFYISGPSLQKLQNSGIGGLSNFYEWGCSLLRVFGVFEGHKLYVLKIFHSHNYPPKC
jgi:hypothetical protein